MFLNIREEDIRADCPHNAPMTLRAFNKISPRQFNTSVSPLNPFEIPRYAPTTVGQFSKALLQQQGSVANQMASQMTSSLSIPVIEEAILAETDVEDFIIDFGDELVQFEEEEEKEESLLIDVEIDPEEDSIMIQGKQSKEPLSRRKKVEMKEARLMEQADFRSKKKKLRGAAEDLAERRDTNMDLSDEERLLKLEKEKRIDYGKAPEIGQLQPLPKAGY
tara:strand:- start:1269 stop:1928 length:660 start_codon:yes stop_codon:yes gene_type:complete